MTIHLPSSFKLVSSVSEMKYTKESFYRELRLHRDVYILKMCFSAATGEYFPSFTKVATPLYPDLRRSYKKNPSIGLKNLNMHTFTFVTECPKSFIAFR